MTTYRELDEVTGRILVRLIGTGQIIGYVVIKRRNLAYTVAGKFVSLRRELADSQADISHTWRHRLDKVAA